MEPWQEYVALAGSQGLQALFHSDKFDHVVLISRVASTRELARWKNQCDCGYMDRPCDVSGAANKMVQSA